MKKKISIFVMSIVTILVIVVCITQTIKLNKIEKTISSTFTNDLKKFTSIDFSKITENKKAYNIALSSISNAYSMSSLIDDEFSGYDDETQAESLNVLMYRLHDATLNYDTSFFEKLSNKETIKLLNELIKDPLDKNTIKTAHHNIFK
ncbi:hypothetical protein [Clostridium baratii]|uniref:hypothetical protein n=1 Tax=Clostridium baratii TaxID=1561 RepID=UPI0030D4D915